MSTVVPFRISKDIAQKIMELVDAGAYPNRSDLIREAVRRLIASEGLVTQKVNVGKTVALLVSRIIGWNEKSVTDVILFGSFARGEATAESDIDLLVLVEGEKPWMVRQRIYDIVYPVIPVFGMDVSLIAMERKSFFDMVRGRNPFALSVVGEGVQLWGVFLDEYRKGAFGKGS